MSLEQNKQVVLDSCRVLETGDAVAADRIVAPDFNREADDDPDRPDRGLRGPAGLIYKTPRTTWGAANQTGKTELRSSARFQT